MRRDSDSERLFLSAELFAMAVVPVFGVFGEVADVWLIHPPLGMSRSDLGPDFPGPFRLRLSEPADMLSNCWLRVFA